MNLLPGLIRAGQVTLEVTVAAWILAAVSGLIMALAIAIGARPIRGATAAFTTILRSVPLLIILYLGYYGPGLLGINVPPLLSAILAIGLVEGVFTSDYFRGAFATVPASQLDAGDSLGLSRLSVMRLIIVPQALPFAVPPLVNAFVSLLKTATLASAVGVPEILYRAQDDFETTGQIVPVTLTVVIVYVIATIPLTQLARILEKRIREARR